MNNYNSFRITALSLLIFFSACEQRKQEQIPVVQNSSFSSLLPAQTEIKPVVSAEIKTVNKLAGMTPTKLAEIAKTSKRIPLQEMLKANVTFTQNKGQLERFENFYIPEIGAVQFYSKAFCGNAFFGKQGIGYSFQRMGLRDADFYINGTEKEKLTKAERRETIGFTVQFENSNLNALVSGINEQHTKMNFMKGNNPSAFVTDVSSYEKIKYDDLYAGIDLVYYNSNNQLKYDYVLAPKADVKQIQMKYNNINKLELNKKGELEVKINWGTLVDKKPYSYQLIKGKQKEVQVKYVLKDSLTVGFEIQGNYDPSKELIIDPYTVAWSTYVGTATSDDGYLESTCMDNTGRTLGTGWTNNSFPINASANGYNKLYPGGTEAFVFRLNVGGTALDYVTYLGGSSNEVGTGIAVNAAGEICVAGHTTSYASLTLKELATTNSLTVATGPITVNVATIAIYGAGASLALVSGGNVLYGNITAWNGGSSFFFNVTSVLGAGTYGSWDIYEVTSVPFPTTAGAIQPAKTGNDGNDDLFYVKLNGAGNNLIYGTYYGGTASLPDWAIDMALDGSGNAYITGRTQTNAGFSTAGVYKTAAQGGYDGFVLKINSNNTLGYCTYIGGAGNDICKGIVASSTGEVYVAGRTNSSGQSTAGVYQTAFAGADDAFVAKLTTTGNISYFTYLGGTSTEGAAGIDLSSTTNEVVVVGTTDSGNFPMQGAFDNTIGASDGFLTRLNATGTALVYSTYIGGDGTDNTKGNDYSTIAKNGGVRLSAGELPIVVLGINSTAASMAPYLISPITYNTVNQAGGATVHNGANWGGMDDWFITVFNNTASTCLFGMYMGGAQNDYPTAGINIDLTTACVTFGGGVHSLPFPVTPGAFQTMRVNTTTPDQSTVAKICLNEILPVEFFYFNVIESNGNGLLKWGTSSEQNNDYFEIQKSTDGKTFYTIGKVDGNGTTPDVSNYSFVDENLEAGVTYYRIKQVDNNGEYHYSVVKSLAVNAFDEIILSPNPGNGIFTISAQLKTDATVEISVLNVLAEQVYFSQEQVWVGAFVKEIALSELASGVYLVQVKAGNEQRTIRYIKE